VRETISIPWLHWIPLLPLLGAAVNLIIGRKLPRWLSALVGCATVAASCALAIAAVIGLHETSRSLRDVWYLWIQSGAADKTVGALNIPLSFTVDPLAGVMILVVTFVGFLIHVYSIGYMAHDPRRSTFFGYLNLFMGAMLILVLGDSLPVLFIGWEGVGFCSYALIGFWFTNEAYANAGRKAFVVNRIGDFGFLLGIFLLWTLTQRLDFAGLSDPHSIAALKDASRLTMPGFLRALNLSPAFYVGLLLFIGACGKSAQIPLYVWLPDAMAGPTPVSALIHAATMVTAGVYMVARMSFVYVLAPEAMMVVAGVGTATALFAAIIGFAQNDIKKVLAYSTVSQLGFMFAAVGCGAFPAGIFHLFTHAFFKAGLFLGAGSVMHAMGDRTDIRMMGGLRRKIPITHAVFVVYCLAIAGIPPLAGFFSKDDILLGEFTTHIDVWPAWYGKVLWAALSLAALGTAFYMWRLYFLVFSGESRAPADVQHHIHESPKVMTIPLIVLAVGAALLGFLGMPSVWHAPSVVAEWLENGMFPRAPEVEPGVVWGLMGVATALAAVGMLAAWALYRNGPQGAERIVRALGPVHRIVANKFYVDEAYDFLLVRPFRWLAHALFGFVDRILIDGILVNGPGLVVGLFGRVARAWQNGDVQRYLLAMLVGLAAIFFFASRPKTEFTSQTDGLSVRFHAAVGDGVERRGAKAEWDFDGDGTFDGDGVDVSHSYAAPGTYPVVLRVTDLFGHTVTVKHPVEVGR
jgi:NADH-quinone oxidoreductase subunit L